MKKEIIFAIVILLFESISDAQDIAKNGVDAQKAKVVSRLYQATLGANERCKKAAPDASKEFQSELARFNLANANLMKLVRQSPYYESAHQGFAEFLKQNPPIDSPELSSECKGLAWILRSMVDDPAGRNATKEYEVLLSN